LALLQGLADQAALAISNARFYSESQRRLANLQALRQIDVAILGSSEVNVALNVVLDQVTSRLGAHAASALLLNPHMRTLRHAGSRGFHTATTRRADLRLGEGLAGRAALERSVLYVPDIGAGQVLVDGLGLLGPGQVLAGRGEPDLAELASDAMVASEKFVSYRAVPLIAAGQVKGVLEVWHRAPLPLDEEAEEFLETLAGQAAIAIDNASLFRDLQRSNDDLVLAYDSTLEGWSGALDLRDKETEGHSQRVTNETIRLARFMGLPDEEIALIRRGALLHDIGKMGIPDAILLKPGKLSDEEWVVMKKHPTYAYELLSPIAFLRPALDIPYAHHEKWDGSGYPRGLAGEQIPLSARLFAVVDVWDALCSIGRIARAGPSSACWTTFATVAAVISTRRSCTPSLKCTFPRARPARCLLSPCLSHRNFRKFQCANSQQVHLHDIVP
jgi:putative nucleotidyltransferase with HDIG domain